MCVPAYASPPCGPPGPAPWHPGPMAAEVRAKKRCCQSSPRCRRCPLVLKRLARAGHAERTGKRTYVVGRVPKRVRKAARAR
jgi:hypothetical protein